MSADNYVVVDHDGKEFIIEEGYASDDGNPPAERARVKTEAEVEKVIDEIDVIEYGVDWTRAARAACGTGRDVKTNPVKENPNRFQMDICDKPNGDAVLSKDLVEFLNRNANGRSVVHIDVIGNCYGFMVIWDSGPRTT